MSLSSLEYKELLNRFGSDLKEVREDLYEALTEELPEDRKKAALTAGRRKLDEYASLLNQLDDIKKSQAVDRFGEQVAKIRERVTTLSGS